jgi:type I restriction enzyme S subunit
MSNSIKELLELSDLPNGWAVVTLEALVREGLIGLVRSQKEQSVHEGHPYVRMQHYDLEGNWNFLDLTKVLASLEELKRYELKKGDVLFNTRNSYELVGKVAIWDLDTPGYLYNNNILRLRFFNCILPKLVGYQMMSPQFRERLALSKSATTSVCAIYGKDLYCQPLLLPPLNEQRRIVAKIEALKARSQRVKEELEAIAPLLDQFRQSVLAAAFCGDLTADWREKNPDVESASVLLERIRFERRRRWEEAELEKMKARGKTPKNDDWKAKYKEPKSFEDIPINYPVSWTWARAEEVCDFITKGTTPAANKMFEQSGDIPFIKVYNLTNRGFLDFSIAPTFISKEVHNGELARSKVFPGDILMNIVSPPLGKVAIVPDDYKAWNMNQAVAVYRAMPGIENRFLAYCLLYTASESNAIQNVEKRGIGSVHHGCSRDGICDRHTLALLLVVILQLTNI